MFKNTKYFIFILFLFNFIYISNANTATINAISCSRSDVQTAINSASNGDTILVPTGESTWTSYVNVNKGVTIQGYGIGNTIIHKYGFQVYHGINNVRITGFTFDGDGTSSNSNWSGNAQLAVKLGNGYGDTGCKNFRIDNNRFEHYRAGTSSSTGCYTVLIFGYSYGLIDNNEFHDNRGEVIMYQADGAPAFNRSGVGGYTNGTVFIEDNTFTFGSIDYGNGLNIFDGGAGSRIVLRYNTITDSTANKWDNPAELHGRCYGANKHGEGSYGMEVYENDYTSTYTSGSYKFFIGSRGGTGRVYNNRLSGSFSEGIRFVNVRSYKADCTYGTGLCQDNEGYSCLEQINDFYLWNNTINGGAFPAYVPDQGAQKTHIKQNRDYFLTNPGNYTPYTYPHPLRGKSLPPTPTTISPPKGLNIQ